MRVIVLFTISIALSACGEMGQDPEGPHKAYLLLRNDKEVNRKFYIGGYDNISKCLDILKYEAESSEDHGEEFWTNEDFTYGGIRREGWERNRIVGARCEREP
jgi:hypothetical protein